MQNLLPKRLSIPVEAWYVQMRISHTEDEVLGRGAKSRQQYISEAIIAPYLDLRSELNQKGIKGVMMEDIVKLIEENPDILQKLKEQAQRRAA